MRREVCWTERLEDGVKRDIRVRFHAGQIHWQFKRSDAPAWDYDTPPTRADWEELLIRVENRQRRRSATLEDLALIRRGMGD